MRIHFIVYFLAFTTILSGQNIEDLSLKWAEEKISSMTLDEKIGQLFMIRAHSNLGEDHISNVKKQITKYHVGGLCFFQGSSKKQAELINKYQALSKLPLMISMDAEWGLGMRLDDGFSYPKQLTLGAIEDNTLVYDMGLSIANHLNRVGVHVNFAPVIDVNNNPNNPVIHFRSFGEDIYNVATKSFAYMKGLQEKGLLACAKHFPGHGDTDVDSHYDLPVLLHNRKRLDSLEMMPFRVLSQLGVKSVMTAHLSVPALDDRTNRPVSLSHNAITGVLKNQFHFDGLVFTDALEMKGVAKNFEPGIMELEALKAGNDILLLPLDIEKAIITLKNALKNKDISEEELDNKVLKILRSKYRLNLFLKPDNIKLSNISEDINDSESRVLKTRLYEHAVTLVQDENNLVPIQDSYNKTIASVSIGATNESPFQKMLSKFGVDKHIYTQKNIDANQVKSIINSLTAYETVVVNILDMSSSAKKNFGISKGTFDLLFELNSTKNLILVLHGSPYALKFFPKIKTIVQAYEEDPLMQETVAQAIMGVSKIEGKLPVTAHEVFPVKTGIIRPGLYNLGYSTPEYVNISSDSLLAIDTIIEEMIKENAAPGCQILAAKNGRIFFHKAFGYHTPSNKQEVHLDDVYDVASVTKTLATTISLMKLYDDNSLNLYAPLKYYLPDLDTTNKGELIIEDVLAHHSGLPGWIPFYASTIEKNGKKVKASDKYYRNIKSDSFSIEVTDQLYLRSDYIDSIYSIIYNCDLREKRNYRYSDLGFYLFKNIIENYSNLTLDDYVADVFYKPLGLRNTLFNPTKKLPLDNILPSEKDDYFRCCEVRGYVHDMGAAMLGGVCGHAGLFSNTKELAVLMQMLLNGGVYGGTHFLSPQTVRKFTKRYYKSSRRGLGFDMKELDEEKKLNIAEEASEFTFGHLGFTGISVFADPQHDLIYIFLSNRTYPSMNNSIFSRNNYRPRVQSVFYNAIMDSTPN